MLVTCHQAYLLPALSFFAKWKASDGLVLLDQARFVSQSAKFHYANRCALDGGRWYTIPVVRRLGQSISDAVVVDGWNPRSFVDRVRNDYRGARHGTEVLSGFRDVVMSWRGPRLVDLNVPLLRWSATLLGISKPLWLQSELLPCDVEDRDERLAQLVRTVGGDSYLAGPSGRKYMNAEVYAAARLSLKVSRFRAEPYPRDGREWIPYLSVLDALCHCGAAAADLLNGEVEDW